MRLKVFYALLFLLVGFQSHSFNNICIRHFIFKGKVILPVSYRENKTHRNYSTVIIIKDSIIKQFYRVELNHYDTNSVADIPHIFNKQKVTIEILYKNIRYEFGEIDLSIFRGNVNMDLSILSNKEIKKLNAGKIPSNRYKYRRIDFISDEGEGTCETQYNSKSKR
jgi:hypothetical protein